jgi:two-component system CheB/CheR fusion protein
MQSQSGDTPEEQHSDQPEEQSPNQPEPTAYLPDKIAASERSTFPIVGIGASAGGLEAFEKFFAHMPRDSGIAFILAQHLGPGRQHLLGDIMGRFTAMQVRVVEANDGTVVESDRIYILPPDKDAVLKNNTLYMHEPQPVAGVRLPIDIFFRSLAEELKERAICIILSGAGSDGSKGLQFIKEQGGLAIVQSPISATHDGMPQSAINTDLVDYILRPEEMPQQLQQYVRKEFLTGERPSQSRIADAANSLQRIFAILRRQTGHDFSLYKQNTITRRIDRRMTVNQIELVTDYVRYLEQHPVEADILFRELLIGVTSFFRDPPAFAVLQHQVIPRLFDNRSRSDGIRVWVTGCSTGEEAYSIAMLLVEQMDARNEEYEAQIFATDIDEQAIEKARHGIYPENIATDLTAERLQRFFVHENKTFRVTRRLREMVVFAVQSVIKDPPFSRMDMVTCRNLLIYLSAELQQKVFPLFHYALKPGGFLFLGTSETLSTASHLFTAIDRKAAIYQCPTDSSSLFQHMEAPAPPLATSQRDHQDADLPKKHDSDLRQLAEQTIARRYAPTCAVVNKQGDLYYTLGRTGFYLEPPEGEVSTNILHMARKGLQLPLTTALRKIATQRQEVIFNSVEVKTNGETRRINLIVQPLEERGLLLVIFEELPTPPPIPSTEAQDGQEMLAAQDERDQRIRQLEEELHATREYLQVKTEELETTNEESKSANEELQSSNEELQSTNEELETSKEELQSMNEEQVTINTELQSKIEQIERANNDLRNLLASVEVGVIFLDLNLQITRFTPLARRVVSLRDADIGRPLNELGARIANGTNLLTYAQRVLDTLEHITEELQTDEGEWYLLRMLPYRTVENVIAGVIMTFSNITQQKRDREQIPRLMRVAEKSAGMIMMTDATGTIEYVNPHLLSVTGYREEEIIGQTPHMFQVDQEGIAQYERAQQQVLAGEECQVEFRQRHKGGDIYWISASFSPVYNREGRITNIVIAEENISERKQATATRQRMNRLLAALGDWHRQTAASGDAQQASTAMCRLLVEQGGYRGVWVGMVAPDTPEQVQPLAQAGFDEGYLDSLPSRWRNAGQEDSPLRAILLENQQHSLYNGNVIFVLEVQKRILGVLVVYPYEADSIPVDEVETLRTLADNLACILQ